MGNPLDDRGVDAFLALLREGGKGPGPKVEVLEALSLRPVWLATWEPRAEGFRTLINANGEEALAVFSSEDELKAAAKQFNWLESDGSIATHRAIGGDILRHAWTREYAFVVIDIASAHSLEYARNEIKNILRELDSTGSFRTSRPPPPTPPVVAKTLASSFPPPVEKPLERISTMYSMAPRQEEKIERLSDLPTKPHEIPYDSEPPTQPRAALPQREAPERRRKSSRPAHKPSKEPSGSRVEEVSAAEAKLGDGGTYGAASVIPPAQELPGGPEAKPTPDPMEAGTPVVHPSPESSSAPKLNSDAPTAPAAQSMPALQPEKLKLPAVGPIGPGGIEPPPPGAEGGAANRRTATPAAQGPRVVAPSIGDGIKLVELHEPPDEDLLKTLGGVLRGYFEVEWASYCHVGRPAGDPSPAVGLRIVDNYRDNVTAIIKDLCEAGRKHEIEIDVLLIDGHDLLRKAREKAYVFYPWKPKA